jgi:hypothetical protein
MKTIACFGEFLLLLQFAAGTPSGWSQSTIAYTAGPAFQVPAEWFPASLDLDRDGLADFSFVASALICTMDVPASACTWSFFVSTLHTNALVEQGGYATVLPAGEWIRDVAPSNGVWSGGESSTVSLLTYFWSPRFGTSESRGPLAAFNEGYLGVRFHATDGLHYGWVHVRRDFAPVIVDWAYEARPGVGLRAGAKPVPVPLAPPAVVRPGFLRLRWASEIGTAYQVQTKDRLDAFSWANLNFVVPATATNSMIDVPMSGAAQFLRLVEAD